MRVARTNSRSGLRAAAPPPVSASDRLVGRRDELAEIDRFLDSAQWGLHGLLLSGPAGIGKTTLWKAALDRARDRGLRVLVCRPSEVETQLSFAALIDLFGDLGGDVLDALPEPQRIAVEVALMRSRADPMPAPLGISLGVLGMVRAAAEQSPLLIAVDDAPWLDDSSARVLEFALRRLEDARIGLLASQRAASSRAGIPELVAAIAPERRSVISLAPLSVDEVAEIIERHLALTLRRPVLLRIHSLSGGNPFYALEVARALERRGDPDDLLELPIPDSLDDLLRDRIGSLPPSSADVALLAAALSSPTRDVLAAAVGAEAADAGIAAARAAGVVDVEDERIRFSHPLLAGTLYSRAVPSARRAAHRALASVVGDPEERARHLALSTEEPDPDVAAALEEAAASARSRGAGAAAAVLAEAAVRLTPADQPGDRRRRTLTAADYLAVAGDVPRGIATLERLAAETPAEERAPVLAALGHALLHTSDRTAAGRAFSEALPLVGDDLALRVRVESGLAAVAHLTWVDWRAGDRHMTSALRHAEALGDPVLLMETIGHAATWAFQMGRGVPRDLIARAAALQDPRGVLHVDNHPDFQIATILSAIGEIAEARATFERLLETARQRGEWYNLPWILMRLARLEVVAGNARRAEQHLAEGRSTALQSGQDAAAGYLAQAEVLLLAMRGEVDRCRATASHVMRVSGQLGLVHRLPSVVSATALLDLSLRDPASAYAQLVPVLDVDSPGKSEPALLRPMVPLAVEALIGLGRLDDAAGLLEPYERLARQHDREVSIADSLHCRAILLAARGELGPARDAALEGQRRFEALGLPFEAARALLALAEILRRSRQKASARDAASRARAAFEALGAARWADRATDELGRTEGRRPPGAELTETEQRVADLVAAGRTNREIAGALFMSVHTVEAHLTRIYRTLGVRSRTELARHAGPRR